MVDFDLNSREPFVGSHTVILLVLLFLIVSLHASALACEVRSAIGGPGGCFGSVTRNTLL
jgi:hypothetical protein